MSLNGNATGGNVLRGRVNHIDVICLNAYAIAVQNGFRGNVEEWLESLKGEPGKDGITPVKGVDYFTEEDKAELEASLLEAGGIAQMKQDIADIQAELAYEAIDITKFTNSAAGTYEMGTTIAAVNLAWELNKTPKSQTLNGASIGVDVRSESYTGLSITSNKTYSLSVTDEKGATDSASSSITFLNGVYYGSMVYGSTINSAAILDLTKKLQSGKTVNFTVSSDRPVYALPTRYGTPTFKIGGFEYEWEKVSTFDFTNSSGYTERYDVWMHTQDVSGSVTVNVT